MNGSLGGLRKLFVGVSILVFLLAFPPMAAASPTYLPGVTTAQNYTVTFTETGLPAGTTWNVTFAGVTHSTTNSSTSFQSENGTFAYSVTSQITGQTLTLLNISLPPLEEYRSNQSAGVLVVAGQNVTWPTTYTTFYLLFTTSTPASAGFTSPGVGYYPQGSTATIDAAPIRNYTLTAWVGLCTNILPCGAYLGTSRLANVTMSSPTVEVADFTLLTYPVNFEESGLPANMAWTARFNGTNTTSTSSTISYSSANGTYGFSVASPLPYGSGERFVASLPAGNVTVDGNLSLIPESFTAQYDLTVRSASPSMGRVETAGGWYDNGTKVALVAQPAPGYAFVRWVGEGAGNYSGTGNNVSLTVLGAATETAVFSQLFGVGFEESGLPASANWSVTISSATRSTTGSTLAFALINGSYAFTVQPVPGYVTGNRTGFFRVDGGGVTLQVRFHPFLYNITFVALGLSNGTSWEVTWGGKVVSSNATTLILWVPNGTASFAISAGGGYTAFQSPVILVVRGPQNVTVQFIAPAPVDNGVLGIGVYPSYLAIEALVGAALIVAVIWLKAFSHDRKHRRAKDPEETTD